MNKLNPLFEIAEPFDMEFEAHVLERNRKEAELLIKKGYKIKKSVWSGLVAS